jgi:hypothetical protein
LFKATGGEKQSLTEGLVKNEGVFLSIVQVECGLVIRASWRNVSYSGQIIYQYLDGPLKADTIGHGDILE